MAELPLLQLSFMVLCSAVNENMFFDFGSQADLQLPLLTIWSYLDLRFCYRLDLQFIFEMSFPGYPKNNTKITERKET